MKPKNSQNAGQGGKEMNKFIEELKRRGLVKTMMNAADIVQIPDESADNGTRNAITYYLEKDTELCDLFIDEAMNYAMNAVVEKLHIRADKTHKNTISEALMLMRANIMSIFRK